MARGSDRQERSWRRTHRIRMLRGVWATAEHLFGFRAHVVQNAVDDELRRLGAEPERYKRARWDKYLSSGYSGEEEAREYKKLDEPWGGRENEPSWARTLREDLTK